MAHLGEEPPARSLAASVSPEHSLQSAPSASGLSQGWRLMRLNRPAEAAAIFRISLTSGSPQTRQDAAYGLALSYLQMKLPVNADVAVNSAPLSDIRSQQLRLSILTERIRQEYDAGQYREVVAGLESRAALASEPVDLMTLRGWSYFHLHRYEEAQRLFEALADAGYEGAASAAATSKNALRNGRE
jgi:cellulose synthase operon protein C